jgi:hypothetical protein
MLRPTKHAHPDRTVINVAALVLGRLRNRRVEQYAGLRNYVRKAVGGGDFLFLPALNLLYLFGLVEYRPKTDAFEYVGANEAL